MATVPFPSNLSRFVEGWRLANAAKGGVVSITGAQQNIASGAAYWEARLSLNCRRDTDYSDADGFLASLDGPANNFLCGPEDWRGRPWNVNPLTGVKITPDYTRGGAFVNPDTTSELSFANETNLVRNATSMLIRRTKGGFLRPGQYFSYNGHLHIITSLRSADVVAANGQAGPGVVDVNIRPWLRVDCPAGTVLEFAKPVALMQLTRDSAAMVERTTSPLAELALSIKEYF